MSNHFLRDYLYHRTGLNFKWNQKKWKLNTGLDAQNSILKGRLILNELTLRNDFFNWLPKANIEYDFKATRTIRLDYRTRVREPNLEELQPIVDNSDPLNIYIGNPDLRPEYTHNFRLNFNSFDQFSSISIFASLNADFTNHKILNSRTLDEQFRQIIQPVNFGRNSRYDAYVSFGTPIKFLKGRINLTTDFETNNGNFLVNEFANAFKTSELGIDANYSNKNTEVVEIALGFKWTDNQTIYEGEAIQNQSYNRSIAYSDLVWHINDNWTVNTTIDYTRYSNASFGQATTVTLWETGIAYNFLKNNRGTLNFTAKDLLNQNLGINRFSQLNFVQEQRIASLGRYFLLSFRYALSGFGGEEDAIKVVRRR